MAHPLLRLVKSATGVERRDVVSSLDRLLAALPHDMRRAAWRRMFRYEYNALREMRYAQTDEYTFRSFDEHRCIFVHVPKAAGVSILKSLFGNMGGGHTRLRIYQVAFSEQEYRSYFKCTVVRNPWDRVFSAFTYLKRGGMGDPEELEWAREHLSGYDYDEFNRFVCEWVRPDNIYKGVHFVPQLDFITDRKGDIGVDFIGRFENLHEDVGYIAQRIGLAQRLEHLNKTKRREQYTDVYSDEAIEVVRDVYRADIDALGYSFAN